MGARTGSLQRLCCTEIALKLVDDVGLLQRFQFLIGCLYMLRLSVAKKGIGSMIAEVLQLQYICTQLAEDTGARSVVFLDPEEKPVAWAGDTNDTVDLSELSQLDYVKGKDSVFVTGISEFVTLVVSYDATYFDPAEIRKLSVAARDKIGRLAKAGTLKMPPPRSGHGSGGAPANVFAFRENLDDTTE